MPMSWEEYQRGEEARALGDFVARVEAALKAKSTGRAEGCWPLYSADGKDADLDADGCCGIREITGADDELLTVLIGGHKTFCDPSDEARSEELQESYRDVAAEIVCGAEGDGHWTGEDWSFGFTEHLQVPYSWDDALSDQANFDAIAQTIVDAAKRFWAPIRESWIQISADLRALSARVRDKK